VHQDVVARFGLSSLADNAVNVLSNKNKKCGKCRQWQSDRYTCNPEAVVVVGGWSQCATELLCSTIPVAETAVAASCSGVLSRLRLLVIIRFELLQEALTTLVNIVLEI